MRIVVDTNCIISALVKKGISRKILANKEFNFISPDFVYEEIISHIGLIENFEYPLFMSKFS